MFEAVEATMSLIKGGYAVVVLIKGVGMLAFRDPHGIRYFSDFVDFVDFVDFIYLIDSPLCFGTKTREDGRVSEFAAASESIALEAVGLSREGTLLSMNE